RLALPAIGRFLDAAHPEPLSASPGMNSTGSSPRASCGKEGQFEGRLGRLSRPMRAWYRERLGFSVLILPATAWLSVFFTLLLTLIWDCSFGDSSLDGQTLVPFSLDNYARAVECIHLGIIWRSVWIATVAAVICLLIGFALAMGIAFAPR